MSIFISDFLDKEVEYSNQLYLYPIYDDFTLERLKAYTFNWKRITRKMLEKRDVIAVVLVYRVSINIVSERCISKNKLSIKVIENSIRLRSIFSIISTIGGQQ